MKHSRKQRLSGKQNKSRRKQEQSRLTAQDSIFYEQMMQDGMCVLADNMYSRTYAFDDVNYRLSRRDDQVEFFTKWCEIQNYHDPETFYQMLLINRTVDRDDFMDKMYSPLRGDQYDIYRKEMNAVRAQRGMEGNNSIVRERYITYGVQSQDADLARQKLNRLDTDAAAQFKAMGSAMHQLDGEQRLAVISSLLRPFEPFQFSYENLVISGGTTKDAICPSSFDFKPVRTFRFGDKYGQILCATGLPDTLSDNILSDIADLPINLALSLHVQAEDQNKALEYVRRQIGFMDEEASEKQRKATKAGYSAELALPHEFKFTYDKATNLINDMQYKDQHLFRTTLMAFTYGDTEEDVLKDSAQIIAAARKLGVTFTTLDYEQEYGMNSILPLGRNFVQYRRTLTTAAVSIFMPFMAVELQQPGGINYGVNARSNAMISFNRLMLRAANGVILGTPGSGKGMFTKQELVNVFLDRLNDDIIIIDPEAEYAPLAECFPEDSEVLRIYGGSDTHLNPLDITENYGDTDDPLAMKLDFMCSFIEQLSASRAGLDGSDISIIDRALHETYRKYFQNPEPAQMPTLVDFYNVLNDQEEPRARAIALQLEAYITGSLNVFSYRTNVNTEKRLVIYDIKQLGKHLRTVGMLTVLDQIWNKVTSNREKGKRTWIYIDEMQLLFSNDYCSTYFFELWSRARKWGAVPTGTTQNVETLLLSDTARRMLSNSDFVVMLNQSKNDSVQLAELLNISSQQLHYVTNAPKGHGLMYVEGRIIPFNSEFPKHTKLYAAMTTKLEEVSAQRYHKTLSHYSQAAEEPEPISEEALFTLTLQVFGKQFTTVTEDIPLFEQIGIGDAAFEIQSETEPDKVRKIRTDQSGKCMIHLPAGRYAVSAAHVPDCYQLPDVPRIIEIANDTNIPIVLPEKSVRIEFLTNIAASEPFGLTAADRKMDFILYADHDLTALDGTVLPAGSAAAHAERDGEAWSISTMLTGKFLLGQTGQPADAELDLQPEVHEQLMQLPDIIPAPIRYQPFSGTKYDEDGQPMADQIVALFHAESNDFALETAVLTTKTDAEGRYSFDIPTELADMLWKTKILT